MNFRVVPKFVSVNSLEIWFVPQSNTDMRVIAQILMPADNQLSDNVEAANEICAILKKRIRKSVN